MSFFRALAKKLDYLSEDKIDQIQSAYTFAEIAHQQQKRLTGEPYITHPVAVAVTLAEMHMDVECIKAALLHDVIEDTVVTKQDVQHRFGAEVADLVDGVSKLTQIKFRSKAEAQAEFFRKMVLAMAADVRVVLIKLADRLHNLRTLQGLDASRQRRIAHETLDIFSPLAYRLGLHEFSMEMNDLAFSALHPMRARVLSDSVKKARGNRKEVLSKIHQALKEGLSKSYLVKYDLQGREKNLYSIYRKMRNKKLLFNEVMDVYAFRILVETEGDCYRCLGVVHSIYKPLFDRFKDYIASPKANGYQSIHTTLFGPHGVPIEIQIRTYSMEYKAIHGIAAHWMYKAKEKANPSELLTQQWIKGLLEMQQRTGNSLEFMENVKVQLCSDEVYLFSPLGEIFALPIGSTVVDFAYAVHSDIGNTCQAAKVDRRFAPLSTVLVSGQTVEIITSPEASPCESWLHFVITSKARSHVRHVLKQKKRKEAEVLGMQLLKEALKTVDLSFKKLSVEDISLILTELSLPDFDSLLQTIGLGQKAATSIVPLLSRLKGLPEKQEKPMTPLAIKGTESSVISFARCCCPILNDPIEGVLIPGYGVEIHLSSCRMLRKWINQPERMISVVWDEHYTGEFLTVLRIEAMNTKGLLLSISATISEAKASVDDIDLDIQDIQFMTALVRIRVKSGQHLDQVVVQLKQNAEIMRVERLYPQVSEIRKHEERPVVFLEERVAER